MDITRWWIDWVTDVVLGDAAICFAQERKFMGATTFRIPGNVWDQGVSHAYPDLGYAKGGSKINQLKRNYYNEESVREAKKKMSERAAQTITSVGISTIGGAKANSQGHCIRSVVVSRYSPKITVSRQQEVYLDVFYRTTELLRKFGADLLFLKDFLVPEILEGNPWGVKTPTAVRMYFSSCFFSALFIPVLYQFIDPTAFLQQLYKKEGDSQFYRRVVFRTKAMLERDASHYKFQSRRNMQNLAMGFMDQDKIDRKALEKHLKKITK